MVEITYQMVLSTLQTVGILVGIIYYLTIMRNSQKNQQMQLETRQARKWNKRIRARDLDVLLIDYRSKTGLVFW